MAEAELPSDRPPNGVPRWLRRGAVLAVVMLFAALVQIVEAPGANAALPCSGMYVQKRFVGYYHAGNSPHPLEGVSATYRDGGGYNLCTGWSNPAYNFSTAWSMIGSGGAGGGYAQSGVIYHYGDGCPLEMAAQNQYGTVGGEKRKYGACVTPGSERQIWQQMVGAPCPKVKSNIGAWTLLESPWSPHCGSWSFPLMATVAGEANMPDTDVPGNPSYHTIFGNILVQRYIDAAWYPSCGNTNWLLLGGAQVGPRWAASSPDCTQKQIWTK